VRVLATARRFLPALVMMVLIYLASDIPGGGLPQFGALDFDAKKGGHVVGYALLGLAYLYALVPRGLASAQAARVAVLLAILYAVSDEVHQVFVPGRGAGVRDVVIDAVGASLGVGLRLRRQGRRAAAETPPVA
jgi:predicted small integral membrane protein